MDQIDIVINDGGENKNVSQEHGQREQWTSSENLGMEKTLLLGSLLFVFTPTVYGIFASIPYLTSSGDDQLTKYTAYYLWFSISTIVFANFLHWRAYVQVINSAKTGKVPSYGIWIAQTWRIVNCCFLLIDARMLFTLLQECVSFVDSKFDIALCVVKITTTLIWIPLGHLYSFCMMSLYLSHFGPDFVVSVFSRQSKPDRVVPSIATFVLKARKKMLEMIGR